MTTETLTEEQLAEWERKATAREKSRAEARQVGRSIGIRNSCPPSKENAQILALIAEVRRLRGSGDARLREAAGMTWTKPCSFCGRREHDEDGHCIPDSRAPAPRASPDPETRAKDCGCDGYCVCGDGGER